MPSAALIIAAVVIVAILTLVAWSSARRRRTEGLRHSARLQEQFGSEYDRTLAETGVARSAEAELTARQERVSGFDIRHLADDEGKRFDDEWLVVKASCFLSVLVSGRPSCFSFAAMNCARALVALAYSASEAALNCFRKSPR